VDDRFGVEVSRHVVLEGRLADPERLEVVATESWADRYGARVGDQIDLTLPRHDLMGHGSLEELKRRVATDPSASRTTSALVAGIVLPSTEVAPDDQDRVATLFATPAVRQALGLPEPTYGVFHLVLAPGTDAVAVRRHLDASVAEWRSSDTPEAFGYSIQDSGADRERVRRAIGPHLAVLWVLAALAVLFSVLVAIPAVLRQVTADRHDDATLTALGFTSGGRSRLAMLRLIPAALIAAAVAVILTFVSSRWFPIGPVAPFEPDPGLRVDWTVLSIVAVIALVAVPALAVIDLPGRPARPTAGARGGIAERVTRRGAPVPVIVGARLAFPRDSLKLAMRSSILTLGVGVMVCLVAVSVAAGFDRLADEPHRQGWAWDLTVLNGGGYQTVSRPVTNQLLEGAGATGWSYLSFGALRSADVAFPAFGLEPGRGSVNFTLLEGRMPAGADEIALGSTTLRDIGASLGDRVQLAGERATREAVVVGRVVLPALAPSDASRPELGRGAVMTQDGLETRHGRVPPSAVLVEARPGDALNLEQRIVDRLPTDRSLELLHDQQTGELRAWKDDLEQTPIIAIGVAAVLLTGVLVHSVALTVRRRGKELAVIRALGSTARQTRSALRSQSLWMTAAALAFGLPLGVVTGILVWRRVAKGFGVADDMAWPVISILVLLLLLVLAVAVASWWPARRTNRSTVADSLRTE
jgi:hypothetical protein